MKWVSEWKWVLVVLAVALVVRCGKPAPQPLDVNGHWLLEKYEITDRDGKVFESAKVDPKLSYLVTLVEGRADLLLTSGLAINCDQFTYTQNESRIDFSPSAKTEGCDPSVKPEDRKVSMRVEKIDENRMKLISDSYAVLFVLPYKNAELHYTLRKVEAKMAIAYLKTKEKIALDSPTTREVGFRKGTVVAPSVELQELLKKEGARQPLAEVLVGGNLVKDASRLTNFYPEVENYSQPFCEVIPGWYGTREFRRGELFKVQSFNIQPEKKKALRSFLRVNQIEFARLNIELIQDVTGVPLTLRCLVAKQVSATGEFEYSYFKQAVGAHLLIR